MSRWSVTGIVLAGGAGSRLGGVDKGLQGCAGEPLVAHVLTRLRGQVGRHLISANRHRMHYRAIGRCAVIADQEIGHTGHTGYRGPLTGLAAALPHVRSEWIQLVPVDSPFLPLNLTDELMMQARRRAVPGVFPHDGERAQPLFALLKAELARESLDSMQGSVWRWMREIGVAEVAMPEWREQLVNLNDRAAFRRSCRF